MSGDPDFTLVCALKHADQLERLSKHLNLLSSGTAATTVVLRLVDPATHGFPSRVATQCTFVALVQSLVTLIGAWLDFKQLEPTDEISEPMHDFCVFQGAAFNFTALGILVFLNFIAFVTFQVVVRRTPIRKLLDGHHEKRFHAIAWPLCALMAALPFALPGFAYGGESNLPNCFLQTVQQQFAINVFWIALTLLSVGVMGSITIVHFFALLRSSQTHAAAERAKSGDELRVPHAVSQRLACLRQLCCGAPWCPSQSRGGSDDRLTSFSMRDSQSLGDLAAYSDTTVDSAVSESTVVCRPASAEPAIQAGSENSSRMSSTATSQDPNSSDVIFYHALRNLCFLVAVSFIFSAILAEVINRWGTVGADSYQQALDERFPRSTPCMTTYVATGAVASIGTCIGAVFFRIPRWPRAVTRPTDDSVAAADAPLLPNARQSGRSHSPLLPPPPPLYPEG